MIPDAYLGLLVVCLGALIVVAVGTAMDTARKARDDGWRSVVEAGVTIGSCLLIYGGGAALAVWLAWEWVFPAIGEGARMTWEWLA